jgi:hypothetical protein
MNPMRKPTLTVSEQNTLIEMVAELESKLKKRNAQLRQARTRLNVAKVRISKMKETVAFQRQRILELHQ